MKSPVIDIEVTLIWSTDRAIKVSDDGDGDNFVWIPKQYVIYDEDALVGDVITISLRENIAQEKGLI